MAFIEDPQGRTEVEKVSRRLKLPVWKSICKGEFRKWWNEWWDKIDIFAETIEGRQIKAGTGLSGGGNLSEDRTLSLKAPTETEIGGVKQGENITIDKDGTIHGNPTYVHPTETGYKHLPVGGSANCIIKWAGDGLGKWEQIKYSEISGIPTSLKNPYSLKINVNNIFQGGYDGSSEVVLNISSVSADHIHDDRYFTKDEILEKLKNYCPHNVGDIYITTSSENPSSRYLGTTWEKIEDRFLKATASSEVAGTIGGGNTKTISQDNLPAVKLKIDSFSVSRGTMDITGTTMTRPDGASPDPTGAFYRSGSYTLGTYSTLRTEESIVFKASRNWTGSSTAAAPQTVNLGSGQALDITPAFYTVYVWKRLS